MRIRSGQTHNESLERGIVRGPLVDRFELAKQFLHALQRDLVPLLKFDKGRDGE